VTINPSFQSVTLGQDVTVSVEISGAKGVGSVPFHLGFDPNVLEFVNFTNTSPFLGRDGSGVFILATLGGDGREVVVGLSRQGNKSGVDGQGTLVQLTFRPKRPGTTTALSFNNLSVLDSQARILPSRSEGAQIAIQ